MNIYIYNIINIKYLYYNIFIHIIYIININIYKYNIIIIIIIIKIKIGTPISDYIGYRFRLRFNKICMDSLFPCIQIA